MSRSAALLGLAWAGALVAILVQQPSPEPGLPAAAQVPERGSPAPDPVRFRNVSLDWRVVEPLGQATLVEIRPHTGFLHQIRACLAHLGHPVAGDAAYGASHPSGVARQMLHAAAVTWRGIAAASPDPPDFAELCARLRGADR